jgi:5-(carboxyamino)imidazole ribonucleotide synthase
MQMAFIYPMQTIGIIGGGMQSYHLALAAKAMGFNVALLAGQQEPVLNIVDFPAVGNLDDPKEILDFTAGLSALIYQDEHINTDVLDALSEQTYLPQGTDILAITQDRYLEKTFLDDLNVNIAPYTTVVNQADVLDGLASIGYPAVIKPIQKGLAHNHQQVLYWRRDADYSAQFLNAGSAILESWIPADQEFLLMAVKDQDKNVQLLPLIEIYYDSHQLIAALITPQISPDAAAEIQRITKKVAENIDYCGVFGVSFLMTASGNLYTQRIFPGLHVAADIFQQVTGISQYELQLRALLGWPIPKVAAKTNGAMLMILKQIADESYTQIKIKPQWQFNYYPVAAHSDATPIGQIFVTDDSKTSLLNHINATELWHL